MENKKIATSNAEMVSISRAEYEAQQAQLSELKLQNQWLLEQLGLAKKRQFGVSSERIQEGLMDQLCLTMNEAEAYAYGTKAATAEQIAVKAHARKRQSGSVTDIVPEGTATEIVEHRLSEEERTCASCGTVMEKIGKEVHRSLQMEPAKFWIREDVYYTYACKNCEQETGEANILKTPKAPVLCLGSGPHHGTKIRDVFSLVPSGAGVQPRGFEAVPADHGNWILNPMVPRPDFVYLRKRFEPITEF